MGLGWAAPADHGREITLGLIAQEAATQTRSSPPKGLSNRIDVILGELDDDDRAVILGYLRDPDVSAPWLYRLLKSYEISNSERAIQQWRAAQREGTGIAWE